jgi:hypothetical protein
MMTHGNNTAAGRSNAQVSVTRRTTAHGPDKLAGKTRTERRRSKTLETQPYNKPKLSKAEVASR